MKDRTYHVVSAARLREVLSYDHKTGLFRWRVKTGPRCKIGEVAGCIQKGKVNGYRVIRIDGIIYKAARLAWLYMTGEWPVVEVDHENRDRADDAWKNLRLATRSQQLMNTSLRSDNTSGSKGVSFFKPKKLWRARITAHGKTHELGYYKTKEGATAAYERAKPHFHKDFAAKRDPFADMYQWQKGRCAGCADKLPSLNSGEMDMLLSMAGQPRALICLECASVAGVHDDRKTNLMLVDEDDRFRYLPIDGFGSNCEICDDLGALLQDGERFLCENCQYLLEGETPQRLRAVADFMDDPPPPREFQSNVVPLRKDTA